MGSGASSLLKKKGEEGDEDGNDKKNKKEDEDEDSEEDEDAKRKTEYELRIEAELKKTKKVADFSVKDANLSKQNLKDIPIQVALYPNLRYLDLSWNILTAIPGMYFSRCGQLEVFKCGFNEIEQLPNEISECMRMEVVDVQTNFIHFLPPTFVELRNLKELYAANNMLDTFPREIANFDLLHTVDLSRNKIERVGKTLGSLRGLVKLSLSNNKIPEIPPAMGHLTSLRQIQLSNNVLKKLPGEIRLCHALEYLDVSSNELDYLPKTIGQCKSLAVLRVTGNKLRTLPEELCSCTRLEELHAGKNKLRNLTGQIQLWTRLHLVDLRDNELQFCPTEIGRLLLKEIYLEGNKRLRIPLQVTDKGTAQVMGYLQTLGEQHRQIDAHLEQFTFATVEGEELVQLIIGQYEDDDEENEEDKDKPESLYDKESTPIGIEGSNTPATEGFPTPGGSLHSTAVRRKDRRASAERRMVPLPHEQRKKQGQVAIFGNAVQSTIEYLANDPKLKKLAFQTKEDKIREMRDAVEMTRKLLADKNMDYGNVTMRQIRSAPFTGICNLKAINLKSIPPELAELGEEVKVLDLRDNQLDRLSAHAMTRPGVMVLSASYNAIAQIAEPVQLPELRLLNLAFNALADLPESLADMPNLELLYVSNNFLNELPESFSRMTNLTDLYVSENSFPDFPIEVCGMESLQKLSVACNQITMIPSDIKKLQDLRFLDCSFNSIQKLPNELSLLVNLERLNASYNPLGKASEYMPEVLFGCTGLVELNLDYTKVKKIGVEIGKLSNLQGLQMQGNKMVYPYEQLYTKEPLLLMWFHNKKSIHLDLSKCDLDILPTEIGRLTNLQSLDLSYNNIGTIPVEMGFLTALQYLSVEGNPLESPFDVIRREPFGDLEIMNFLDPYVAELDVTGCGFEEIPPLLLRHSTHLHALNVSDNSLTSLPEDFATMFKLKVLVLDANYFEEFPFIVCDLVNLEVLQFSKNKILSIPESICKLQNLQELVMDSNELVSLPESISELTTLETLAIPNNNLTSLPSGIGNLDRLKLLDLRCNSIQALPNSICMMGALEVLDLRINEIVNIPAQIGKCIELREMNLSNNAIRVVPPGLALLTNLQVLVLGANHISALPMELCSMTFLQELQLFGNPLPDVASPANVKGTGVERYLSLLKQIFKEEQLSAKELEQKARRARRVSVADTLKQKRANRHSFMYRFDPNDPNAPKQSGGANDQPPALPAPEEPAMKQLEAGPPVIARSNSTLRSQNWEL